MLRVIQKIVKFDISKFEAAAKAIKESKNEEWPKKMTEEEKNELWSLYKQATVGYNIQMPMSSSGIRNPSSPRFWSQYQGRTKQQAEQDYVKLAKNLLEKYGAQSYIKDF